MLRESVGHGLRIRTAALSVPVVALADENSLLGYSSFVLSVFLSWQDFTLDRTITSELIRDNHSWHVLETFEQFAKKLLGCSLVTPTLHQNIEHVAKLIDGSPKVVLLSIDFQKHLIEMPLVPTTRSAMTQFIGIGLTKFQASLPNCFIGQHDTTLGYNLFNITITQRKVKIQPDAVAGDFRREAKTFV